MRALRLVPLLPPWVWWLLAVAALLAAASAGWSARGVVADRDLAALREAHGAELRRIAEARAGAEAEQRRIENRRTIRQLETLDAETIRVRARPAAIQRAAVVGDGLRLAAEDLADAAGSAGRDPAAAGSCQAADAALRVYADVLADMERTGRELAIEADDRGAAGKVCEALYQSLTETEADMHTEEAVKTPAPAAPAASTATDASTEAPRFQVPTGELPRDEAGWRESNTELSRIALALQIASQQDAAVQHAGLVQAINGLAAAIRRSEVSREADRLALLASTIPGSYSAAKVLSTLQIRATAMEAVLKQRTQGMRSG